MTERTSDTTALVTGASGFIGRRLVQRLTGEGCRVLCLVRSSSVTGPLQSWGAELLTCDLNDHDAVRGLVAAAQPTVVFHLAGLVRARRTRQFVRVNAHGTGAVAAACAHCAHPPVLVVISSLAAAGPSPDHRPRTETDAPQPVSAYGRSKRQGELAAAKHMGVVPITIVRPPVVFGPEDRAVLRIMRLIARWGVHVVPGKGSFHLSMVHVDDLVEGLIRAWMHGDRIDTDNAMGHGVYFMAAREHPLYTDLGGTVAQALGISRVRVVRFPSGLFRVAGVLGDVASQLHGRGTWINSDKVREALAGSWTCCSERAREHLQWEPASTLEHRLGETARWYRQVGWL